MPHNAQNVVLDTRPRARNIYYTNEDEVVGLEVRKKSIAGNIWECLTGKKRKPELIFFEDEIRPQQDVILYDQGCCNGSLTLMPTAIPTVMPILCGYHDPSPWRYRFVSEDFDCHGCVCCLYDRCLGPLRRPYPRRRRGAFRYDYYEHGEKWDRYSLHGSRLPSPRRRRSGRSIWRRRRDETATQLMRREMIELMQERLDESRHERIYGQWPSGYSLDSWRRREDRVQELDDRIEDLRVHT